jgi:hypothetical protein
MPQSPSQSYFGSARHAPSAEPMAGVYEYVSPQLEDKVPTLKRIPESRIIPPARKPMPDRAYTSPAQPPEPVFKRVPQGITIPRFPFPRVQSMHAEFAYAPSTSSDSSYTDSAPERPRLARAPTNRQFEDFLPAARVATWNEVKQPSGQNIHPFQTLAAKGLRKARKEVGKAAGRIEGKVADYRTVRW